MKRRKSIWTILGLGLCGIPASSAPVLLPPPKEGKTETYVEMSGRQTGKSTRMRQFVVEQLKAGKSVRVHTLMPNLFMRQIEVLWPVVRGRRLQATDNFELVGGVDVEVFDDWDNLDAGVAVPFIPGGYYTTTLSRLRDPRSDYQDTLFRQLFNACGRDPVNFMWSNKTLRRMTKSDRYSNWNPYSARKLAVERGFILADPTKYRGKPIQNSGENCYTYTLFD